MISTLSISHFKSIKELTLPCKRVNVFIGQPNVGKSNILEALGFASSARYTRPQSSTKDFLRFERVGNLFYDEGLETPVEIRYDGAILKLAFSNNRFQGQFNSPDRRLAAFDGTHNDLALVTYNDDPFFQQFKSYRFMIQTTFDDAETKFLLPPYGRNLQALLLANRDLRNTANQPFAAIGLRLGIRPQEHKLEIIKQIDDVIISYPYSLASETLQRLTFYLAAILSNKESVLVFEEPESHAFPYYTKYLAELIALDDGSNQYFMSTHNPYFLLPLLEKSNKEDIAIFVTYYEDYQTKVKQLSEKDISEFGEVDVFSNIERYLDKA